MPISQAGALNTMALVVPDAYIQNVPPQNSVINGVPTNVVGMVGSAQWGPLNQPTIVGSMADYAKAFGAIQNRKYDMGTQVATAVLQGASNFRCVRVSDGTDAAATIPLVGTGSVGVVLTALYTGTLGNSLTASLSTGSKASTFRLTIGLPNQTPEVFDNIPGTGATFWANLVAAVNTGNSITRPGSLLVVASLAGSYVTAPAAVTVTLTGGSDGVATPATVLTAITGVDTTPRTGMYALRGQGCSIAVLADYDTSSNWSVAASFGLAEGIYMILTGPTSDTIANAVTVKNSAGLDTYSCKLMHGDWIYWNDQANGVLRLVSPQGFVAGRLANLSPEQSSLNKPLYGVQDTQKSGVNPSINTGYSTAELQTLLQAGIDVISNPQPGGSFWGVRGGHNSSSNAATNGDNYTRLTNFIAATLSAGMGIYVGQVVNAGLFRKIRSTMLSFFQNMLSQGLLGSLDGSLPFNVVCDLSNNPLSRTSLGYVQSDAQVQYQSINEKFIVNVEGGQTVQVSRQTLPSGQA